MRTTKIVTCFLISDDKILILKRSKNVKTMKNLWGGISGIIEKNERPLSRAKIEIMEEVGLNNLQTRLVKSANEIRIHSPQYKNHEWLVFPFLFLTKNPIIKLNWENSEYKWINAEQVSEFETVPELDKVLFSLS